jgi:hypothetical protein
LVRWLVVGAAKATGDNAFSVHIFHGNMARGNDEVVTIHNAAMLEEAMLFRHKMH